MQLKAAIVHRIDKETNTNEATPHPRDNELPIDARLTALADQVRSIYDKTTSRGNGRFDPDEDAFPFSRMLREFKDTKRTFVQLSHSTLTLISARMREELFATGGFVLFLNYTNLQREWLLVVMLKQAAMTAINPETLEIEESRALDVDHMHEAARVDVTKWLDGQEPYLTFAKGRVGRADVTRYFRNALGCTDYTEAKANTTYLIEAFEHYADDQGWTKEQKQNGRERLHSEFVVKNRANEPIRLEGASAIINHDEPAAFAEFVRGHDELYPISDEFAPHPDTYRRLKRLRGKIGNVSISFDIGDLENGFLHYDDQGDAHTLTLTRLSDDLDRGIRKALGKDE
jgi:nucleoid-associated protein